MKQKWYNESLEAKYCETLSFIFEEIIEDFFEDEDMMEFYSHVLMDDMKEIENTFNAMKELGYYPEDIEYMICEEGICAGKKPKEVWDDEPPKETWVQWRPTHCVVV